jgi:hypothetical protein
MIKTPRNGIQLRNKVPARWNFFSIQRGHEYTMKTVMEYIDTVAEHADALMGANGINANRAVEQAIKDLIKGEKENYYTGDYWKLTPTHRKAIIKWLEAA